MYRSETNQKDVEDQRDYLNFKKKWTQQKRNKRVENDSNENINKREADPRKRQ